MKSFILSAVAVSGLLIVCSGAVRAQSGQNQNSSSIFPKVDWSPARTAPDTSPHYPASAMPQQYLHPAMPQPYLLPTMPQPYFHQTTPQPYFHPTMPQPSMTQPRSDPFGSPVPATGRNPERDDHNSELSGTPAQAPMFGLTQPKLTPIFDQGGKTFGWTDGKEIYDTNGKAVSFIKGGAVYNNSGDLAGWFLHGYLTDTDGNVGGSVDGATGGPRLPSHEKAPLQPWTTGAPTHPDVNTKDSPPVINAVSPDDPRGLIDPDR